MNKKLMETVKSRKFWFALVAAVVPILNEQLGWNLDTTTVLGIVGSIIAWILGEAYMDGAKITTNPIKKEEIKPTETLPTELPKSIAIEALDKQENELTRATTELWTIEKTYREGKSSLPITLASIDAWKKQYPTWAGLIPPGFPSI